jgi:hypothetical protein
MNFLFFVSIQEEAGIEAPLEHAGTLLFLTEGAQWAFHIDIYMAEEYTGVITEWVLMCFIRGIHRSVYSFLELMKCDHSGLLSQLTKILLLQVQIPTRH